MPNVRIIQGMAFVRREVDPPREAPLNRVDIPYPYGTVLELDDEEAQRLIDLGAAEETDAEPGSMLPFTELQAEPSPIDSLPDDSMGEGAAPAEGQSFEEFVSSSSVSEVLAYADENPDDLNELYDAEMQGQQRKTLMAGLEERMGAQ